jgi:hypothetical protein
METQNNATTKEQIDVAIVSNDYYETNEVIGLFVDDDTICVGGVYRAYHADVMFEDNESLPDIVVGNGKVKDRISPRYEEPVTVGYPTKSKAKASGITYVRERRNPKSTKRAINRAAKKISR